MTLRMNPPKEDDAPQELVQKSIKENTKHITWKYFGAMFMEKKDGVNAVSLTRLLALTLFIMLLWKWSGVTGQVDPVVAKALTDASIDIPLALKASSYIPETLLYTFWGLLGGKTAESVIALWKGKKGT